MILASDFLPTSETDYENANSYLTLEETNEYFENEGKVFWSSLEDDFKKVILMKMSFYLDNLFCYKGSKTLSTQILEFPRDGGVLVERGIKYAVYNLLENIVKNEVGLYKDIKEEEIGKLRVVYGDSGKLFKERGYVNVFLKKVLSRYIRKEYDLKT